MRDFEAAVRAHGLLPRKAVVPDGRRYRCPTESHPKKRNGVYFLAADGAFGWYRDWAIDAEPVYWFADGKARDSLPPPPDPAEQRRKREQERRSYREATRKALEHYSAAHALRGGHPYLESKGIATGCDGLKVDAEGWLLVPAMRRGRLVSLQRIAPDGRKLFWPGAPMTGVSFGVERPNAPTTVLCEGLATGLTIFRAAPLCRVLVCFTAGNMRKVAERVPLRGNVVVAADNDHGTAEKIGKNPGILAAEEAAAVLGCGIMVPKGMAGTDWNDWYAERLAARLEARRANVTENAVRRSVEAEIAMEVARHARYLMPTLAKSESA